MKIKILTMFPSLFESFLQSPVIKRCIDRGYVLLELVDIKDFASGSFRHIDDSPCGGGPGMILKVDVVMKALESVSTEKSHSILLSPKGRTLDQKKVRELANMDELVFICGHYEGIDARVEKHVDELLSIGDYILTGGEVATMVIIDAISRLQKGTIREGATEDESHENGLLEYPQYTKPIDYKGDRVPKILLSGNHGAIDRYRHKQALLITREMRPDMFARYELSEEEKRLIEET
ncbi:MAG: tRNA (guanosine(37)-N1)-methyltransferase TrmD [Sphaerochaetaceae bacterium]|nr:tRNA (guanosine(37)-N1)-methyltransferase TrmD [Sphaerochaetaceae bacterium]